MKQQSKKHANPKALSTFELRKLFPDEESARKWLEGVLWTEGPKCPHCGSFNVQCGISHPSQTHRCRDCKDRKMFSVKTGTAMSRSKLSCLHWAIAIYEMATSPKGVSSIKLGKILGIPQNTAWRLGHKIRSCFPEVKEKFNGPVEVDETFIGGKEKNKHANKKLRAGRGAVGKTIVVGALDRETEDVRTRVIGANDRETLHQFVYDVTKSNTLIYTDEAKAYLGMKDRDHQFVCHSIGQYVVLDVHTNGLEGFWSILKRSYYGIHHYISRKYLHLYLRALAGYQNMRDEDEIDRMKILAAGMAG